MKLINATAVPDGMGSALLSMRRDSKNLNPAAIKRAGRRKQRRFLRAELVAADLRSELASAPRLKRSDLVKMPSNEPTPETHWMTDLPSKVLRLFRVPSSYMREVTQEPTELRTVIVKRKSPLHRTTVEQLLVAY